MFIAALGTGSGFSVKIHFDLQVQRLIDLTKVPSFRASESTSMSF